jgi:hypothetical protein
MKSKEAGCTFPRCLNWMSLYGHGAIQEVDVPFPVSVLGLTYLLSVDESRKWVW